MTEEFIKENGSWIDDVCEANDNLGTCQGVAMTTRWIKETGVRIQVDVVQLVFDHGIVEARLDTLQLISTRLITRFDEI